MIKEIFLSILFLSLMMQVFTYKFNINDASTFITSSVCKCKQTCLQNDKCILVYWKSTYDSFFCNIQTDAKIPVQMAADVNFYCRGCLMSSDLLQQKISSGAIQYKNIALNKETEASSYYTYNRNEKYISKMAVDGDQHTRYVSEYHLWVTVPTKQWLMIDLGKDYTVYEINMTTIEIHRIGHLKIYLSETFNRNDNFSSYPMIVDVPGIPTTNPVNYQLDNVKSGRYVIVQRQLTTDHLDIYEIEIYSPISI